MQIEINPSVEPTVKRSIGMILLVFFLCRFFNILYDHILRTQNDIPQYWSQLFNYVLNSFVMLSVFIFASTKRGLYNNKSGAVALYCSAFFFLIYYVILVPFLFFPDLFHMALKKCLIINRWSNILWIIYILAITWFIFSLRTSLLVKISWLVNAFLSLAFIILDFKKIGAYENYIIIRFDLDSFYYLINRVISYIKVLNIIGIITYSVSIALTLVWMFTPDKKQLLPNRIRQQA